MDKIVLDSGYVHVWGKERHAVRDSRLHSKYGYTVDLRTID